MAADFNEFFQFLTPNAREDVKIIALETLLGLTSENETCLSICKANELLDSLLSTLNEEAQDIKTAAITLFTNLSSVDDAAEILVKRPSLLQSIFHEILKETNEYKESMCKLLSNLSRSTSASNHIFQYMKENNIPLDSLIDVFSKTIPPFNVDYLAGVFSNLTQLAEVRSYLMEGKKQSPLLKQLLPYIKYEQSEIRKDGVVGTIRNCCFDDQYHEWLLSEEIDLLPQLLLPLAGPEEFEEEEMDSLPLELQYLGEEKEREPSPQIRTKLLEALLQLCATKKGRDILKKKRAYLILRELHKWEKNPVVQMTCENVVQILIGDDPAPGMENLKLVDVPQELTKKFEEMDGKFIEDAKKDENH